MKNLIFSCIFFLISCKTHAKCPDERRFSDCRSMIKDEGLYRSPIVLLSFDHSLKKEVVLKRVLLQEIFLLKIVVKFEHSIKFLGHFQTGDGLFVITEYGQGGDLFSLANKSRSSAAHYDIVRVAFNGAIKALAELHKHHIAHLDVKPENFFIVISEDEQHIKIGDFGRSIFLPYSPYLRGRRGSFPYMAPEVFKEMPYDPFKADTYSAGMMLGSMLLGRPLYKFPMLSDQNYSLMVNNNSAMAVLKCHRFRYPLDPEVEDLLEKMTDLDPKKRLTMEQVLKHPWLEGLNEVEDS